MRRLCLTVLLLMLVALQGGCGVKLAVGGGNGEVRFSGGSKQLHGDQSVMVISYMDALDLILDVAEQEFLNAELDVTGQKIKVYDSVGLGGGDFEGQFWPVALENKKKLGEYGIVVMATGGGAMPNPTLIPASFIDRFFEALKNRCEEEDVPTAMYQANEYRQVRGAPLEIAEAGIPTSVQSFAYWLKKKRDRPPYEGVYELSSGEVTLGLYAASDAGKYKYKAVVLESRARGWKVGEVIIKFKKIRSERSVFSRMVKKDGSVVSVVWETTSDGLMSKVKMNEGHLAMFQEDIDDVLEEAEVEED